MKQYLLNQITWILPILILLLVVATSISYKNYYDISEETDIVNIAPMGRVDCWQIDHENNIVVCRHNVRRCPEDMNVGTPPPPLRCPNP
jgi:hypothetical protein